MRSGLWGMQFAWMKACGPGALSQELTCLCRMPHARKAHIGASKPLKSVATRNGLLNSKRLSTRDTPPVSACTAEIASDTHARNCWPHVRCHCSKSGGRSNGIMPSSWHADASSRDRGTAARGRKTAAIGTT
eukprot:7530993-Lingulodinium_polyedra.AAC.1